MSVSSEPPEPSKPIETIQSEGSIPSTPPKTNPQDRLRELDKKDQAALGLQSEKAASEPAGSHAEVEARGSCNATRNPLVLVQRTYRSGTLLSERRQEYRDDFSFEPGNIMRPTGMYSKVLVTCKAAGWKVLVLIDAEAFKLISQKCSLQPHVIFRT